ncbi:MAG: hypothetical protein V3S29_12430 [bacterium]
MDIQQQITGIKAARAAVREAMEGCEIPQIQNNLRLADMELHWALWNLAEFESLLPELERA